MYEEELNYIAYGYFDSGLNSQNTWQGGYYPSEDTLGRGYPDWLPEHTTLLPPPTATSYFVDGTWQDEPEVDLPD